MFQPAPLSSGTTAQTNYKNVPWRAVDVNRPVTPWCVPGAVRAARARTVTGGLTSPARLVTVGRIQKARNQVPLTPFRHPRARLPPLLGPATRDSGTARCGLSGRQGVGKCVFQPPCGCSHASSTARSFPAFRDKAGSVPNPLAGSGFLE